MLGEEDNDELKESSLRQRDRQNITMQSLLCSSSILTSPLPVASRLLRAMAYSVRAMEGASFGFFDRGIGSTSISGFVSTSSDPSRVLR